MNNVIYQVDAFTDVPFKGNPAGVYICPEVRSENWVRNLAREMNLSETAFLVPSEEDYSLRWFTPAVEVDLCGHATLASAHILWEQGFVKPQETIQFRTRSGILTASLSSDDWISLDFPVKNVESTTVPIGLFEGLGIKTARFVGSNKMDFLVELDNEEQIRGLNPDHSCAARMNVAKILAGYVPP